MKPATPSTPGEQAKVYMSNKHEIMVVKVTQDHYESGPKLHKYITAMITDDKEMTQLKTEIIAHCKAMTAPPIMKRKFSVLSWVISLSSVIIAVIYLWSFGPDS